MTAPTQAEYDALLVAAARAVAHLPYATSIGHVSEPAYRAAKELRDLIPKDIIRENMALNTETPHYRDDCRPRTEYACPHPGCYVTRNDRASFQDHIIACRLITAAERRT